MSTKEINLKEKFKQALESTARVISDDLKAKENPKKNKNHPSSSVLLKNVSSIATGLDCNSCLLAVHRAWTKSTIAVLLSFTLPTNNLREEPN